MPLPTGDSNVDTFVTQERAARAKESLSTDEIYERILTAIVEHRLPPGTQLIEERLAKIFDVSRTQIRQVMVRLAPRQHRTVHSEPRRLRRQPTVEEAREVFAARRLIEPDLVRQAIARGHREPMSHGCATRGEGIGGARGQRQARHHSACRASSIS